MPETSIIIRTYNEQKHLPALLDALRRQEYRDQEILVVDSGSIDGTREIAARHGARVLRIDSRDFTFGYSLNAGIREASGRFLALVSAHTLPLHERWLGTLVEPLKGEKTSMVYGRQLGALSSKFGEIQDFRRQFGTRGYVLRPPRYFANNANSAVRRDLWNRHPFDESLPGLEDVEWAKHWMDRGYAVVYEPSAALRHIHEESWAQIRRRYSREAAAARWIGVKGLRHLAIEPLREAAYLAGDLGRAFLPPDPDEPRRPGLLRRLGEIVLFRTNKTAGTMRGLLNGIAMENPMARQNLFFERTTTTVTIEGPGRAGWKPAPIPEVKPGDVLIRVAYEGVCGTDLEILEGTLGYYRSGWARYPIVPGHEVSGRILSTGPNVTGFREGDAVVVECIQSCGTCGQCRRGNAIGCPERSELGVVGRNGGYAGHLVVPARFVHLLPPGADLRKASLCEPLAVVLKGVARLSRSWPAEPASKRCAVVGAGPLGHLCARVLHRNGHRVAVFDREPRRRAYFQGTEIADEPDFGKLPEFDAVVEATGHPDALDAALQQSAPGATILLLGLPYARKEYTFETIVSMDKTIVGSVGSGPKEFEEAIRILPELDVDAFLECLLPLDQFEKAWDLFRERRHLKIILETGGSA